jgi:hypothetical protein
MNSSLRRLPLRSAAVSQTSRSNINNQAGTFSSIAKTPHAQIQSLRDCALQPKVVKGKRALPWKHAKHART